MQSPPPILLLWALWFLLFRFMFASGIVKLLSGCREWWDLSAMKYHYETQPIPNRLAYYAHQQSKILLKLSTLATFFFEMFVPFLIFGNNWMRLCASILLILFQLILMATGNFAFFNLLTIALCLPLLDNTYLEWLFGVQPPNLPSNLAYSPVLEIFLNGVGLLFIVLNLLHLINMFITLRFFQRFMRWIEPYDCLNSYGLFANMTTRRDEIIVEGSLDGKEWKTYEFKWKPGDLQTPPKLVAPYHPRLDWQMWFAALSPYQANPWLINFLARLLEGSKDVEALLKNNPFPDHPPKFIRTLLYEYHFSNLATKRATGQWWVRRFKRLYAPVLSRPDQKSTSLDGFND